MLGREHKAFHGLRAEFETIRTKVLEGVSLVGGERGVSKGHKIAAPSRHTQGTPLLKDRPSQKK